MLTTRKKSFKLSAPKLRAVNMMKRRKTHGGAFTLNRDFKKKGLYRFRASFHVSLTVYWWAWFSWLCSWWFDIGLHWHCTQCLDCLSGFRSYVRWVEFEMSTTTFIGWSWNRGRPIDWNNIFIQKSMTWHYAIMCGRVFDECYKARCYNKSKKWPIFG